MYVLGPDGKASLPTEDLQLHKIRSRLSGKLKDPEHDWFTNFGNLANTNASNQDLNPPFRLKWIRRYEGTFKHTPVCGGERMYTHTAEGQIFAVEQETGRLLWRRYWPGVHLSFTSPIYHEERLFVPQAGIKGSLLRCLDAATGELIWQAPRRNNVKVLLLMDVGGSMDPHARVVSTLFSAAHASKHFRDFHAYR